MRTSQRVCGKAVPITPADGRAEPLLLTPNIVEHRYRQPSGGVRQQLSGVLQNHEP